MSDEKNNPSDEEKKDLKAIWGPFLQQNGQHYEVIDCSSDEPEKPSPLPKPGDN